MQAIARFFVAATLAFTLSVPTPVQAEDHGGSQSLSSGIRRPRAVCGPFGCYVFPRRGFNKRYRGFRMFLGFGGFSLSINSYSSYYGYGGYGGYGGYYSSYGYGVYGGGYGGGYGPYRPGDYRNAYAGLFGRYVFPPAF